ncbi:MAG: flagellar basal body rod protein FlgC [Vampirovibrionales bacterium]
MMMSNGYNVIASALSAQRLRMDVIASNLANINTTRQADGTKAPYLRKNVVFQTMVEDASSDGRGEASRHEDPIMTPDGRMVFQARVEASGKGRTAAQQEAQGVHVVEIATDDKNPPKQVYDPSHPDADANGYVAMPNVNMVTEMIDMISASRAYEANLAAYQNLKMMEQAEIDG